MLPPANRMRRSADFSSVVRDGVRGRGRQVIVHQRRGLRVGDPVVGFVVSKAVGGSVVRHRVTRRLRAQMGPRIARLPGGSGTVVRALPAASLADSAELAADLDRVLDRLAGSR